MCIKLTVGRYDNAKNSVRVDNLEIFDVKVKLRNEVMLLGDVEGLNTSPLMLNLHAFHINIFFKFIQMCLYK